jgi:hypothetical protein
MTSITSPFALKVIEVMKQYCSMPEPILTTQVRFIKKTADEITAADIPVLAPLLGRAIAMFTNPEKGKKAEEDLLSLR